MPRLLLLALLLLAACFAAPPAQQIVRVRNATDEPVRVRLEERHPQYDTSVSKDVEIAAGQTIEMWWAPDFETTLVIRNLKKELRRKKLAEGVDEIVHR